MKQLTKAQVEFLNRYVIDELEWSYSNFKDKVQFPRSGNWKLNSQGKVDVGGSFACEMCNISSLRGIVFGRVEGFFDISNNKISSTEGFPEVVGDLFNISDNPIASLVGPTLRVGSIYFGNCKIRSLEGLPKVESPKGVMGNAPYEYNPSEGEGEYESWVKSDAWKILYDEMLRGATWEEALERSWRKIPMEELLKLDLPPNFERKHRGLIQATKLGLI
jgi:hypothetical protein